MRKLTAIILCAVMLSSTLAGCGGGGSSKRVLEGTPEEILELVYAGLDDSFELPFVMNVPLSEDMGTSDNGIRIDYYIGSKDIPFAEGVASEAAIGGAYSVVILRMKPGADIAKAKQDIKDNVNPSKWICYHADVVIVDNVGDVIILIMTNDEIHPGLGQAIHDSFLNLK